MATITRCCGITKKNNRCQMNGTILNNSRYYCRKHANGENSNIQLTSLNPDYKRGNINGQNQKYVQEYLHIFNELIKLPFYRQCYLEIKMIIEDIDNFKAHGHHLSIPDDIDEWLNHSHKTNYDLIYGMMQSGKSPSICLLLFYSNIINEIPIYLFTTPMNSAKENIKESISMLNQDIHNICKMNGYPVQYYQINVYEPTDNMRMIRKMPICNSSTYLFLIQHQNFKKAKIIYNKFANNNGTIPIFIIDEFHRMFTNIEEINKTKRIQEEYKHSCASFLRWIKQITIQQNKTKLIGVSATVARAITCSDFYPQRIVRISPNYDVSSEEYYSISNGNVEVAFLEHHTQDKFTKNDVLQIIQTILNRPHHINVSGFLKAKFILVATDMANTIQSFLETEIQKHFPNVFVQTFNQNSQSLKKIFNKFECESKTRTTPFDAFILIAKACVRESISIKTKKPIIIGNYELTTLTDEIYNISTYGETNCQNMRIFGKDEKNQKKYLWISKNKAPILINDLNIAHNMAQIYKSNPQDIDSMILPKNSSHLFNGESITEMSRTGYVKTSKTMLEQFLQSQQNKTHIEYDVELYSLSELLKKSSINLNAKLGGENSGNILRNIRTYLLKNKRNLNIPFLTNKNFNLYHKKNEFNRVLRASVCQKVEGGGKFEHKEDDEDYNYLIKPNFFIYGELDDAIKDCILIRFKIPFEEREELSGENIIYYKCSIKEEEEEEKGELLLQETKEKDEDEDEDDEQQYLVFTLEGMKKIKIDATEVGDDIEAQNTYWNNFN